MRRKCVQKFASTPENMPNSILGEDCAFGWENSPVRRIFTIVSNFGDFLTWAFQGCSHNNKSKPRSNLWRKYNKISTYIGHE